MPPAARQLRLLAAAKVQLRLEPAPVLARLLAARMRA